MIPQEYPRRFAAISNSISTDDKIKPREFVIGQKIMTTEIS
jgi:hypothetical protein